MKRVALVLACFACPRHGRRLHATRHDDDAKPVHALAGLLVADMPAAGWQSLGGAGLGHGLSRRARRRFARANDARADEATSNGDEATVVIDEATSNEVEDYGPTDKRYDVSYGPDVVPPPKYIEPREPLKVSSILRSVNSLDDVNVDLWRTFPSYNVLELAAGEEARWTAKVGKFLGPGRRLVATDLKRPKCECATNLIVDNKDLGAFADQLPGVFDVVYGEHLLCACNEHRRGTWPLIAAARAAGLPGNVPYRCGTCAGVDIEEESVDKFVGALKTVLRPGGGFAVFDQSLIGAGPLGLENFLMKAAQTHGVHVYPVRAPLWANVNYVISTTPLNDDVGSFFWQRNARKIDLFCTGLLAFGALCRILLDDTGDNFFAYIVTSFFHLTASFIFAFAWIQLFSLFRDPTVSAQGGDAITMGKEVNYWNGRRGSGK